MPRQRRPSRRRRRKSGKTTPAEAAGNAVKGTVEQQIVSHRHEPDVVDIEFGGPSVISLTPQRFSPSILVRRNPEDELMRVQPPPEAPATGRRISHLLPKAQFAFVSFGPRIL